ncbi:uncharacterized protein TNCV_264511 [Trichonephila clavipes]|nr:uncharacterized protein TNCV_264511 [Trichonephila clavipes]
MFIGYKQSLDNAPCIAFSQCNSTTRLNEDETANDGDIINNLINYGDGQEPDSLRAEAIYVEIQVSNKWEKHFLKIDTNSERSLKFTKEPRSCISGYRNVH